MTIAIKWGDNNSEDGGFIHFDSVTVYTENYSGQVTKHAIDGGASVTDHFIRDNSKFTMSAVITGVDISTGSYNLQDEEGNRPFNTRFAPTATSVNSTDQSVLTKFIPDSIGQFLPDTEPSVTMDDARASLLEQIHGLLSELVSGVRVNRETGRFENDINLLKLYSYRDGLLNKVTNNIVLTSIQFKEDPNTGYALYCDMTFEQVSFATLKLAEIPTDVSEAVKPKAAAKKSEGKVGSTVKDTDDLDNTDIESKKDDLDRIRTTPGFDLR